MERRDATEGKVPDACLALVLWKNFLRLQRHNCAGCLQPVETVCCISLRKLNGFDQVTWGVEELFEEALPALPCLS